MLAAVDRFPIRPQVKWVDLAKAKATIRLPEPWQALEARKFHQDLVDRAYGHLAYVSEYRLKGLDNAVSVLEALGEGFLMPFSPISFEPKQGDPSYDLKMKALNALNELRDFYGDRVSAVVWESFASLACRAEPEVEKSIIQEGAAGTLPYHYTIVDTMLHAAGLVYTFILHVNSVMFKHTGRILVHNCDCNHSLVNLEAVGGSIDYTPPAANIKTMTQSVFTHSVAETIKLMEDFLPFAYCLTPEAAEIQAIL